MRSENTEQIIGGSVSKQRMWDNLRMLCDTIGIRYTGTEGERKAAVYIKEVLESIGLHPVDIQSYPLETWTSVNAELQTKADPDYRYRAIPLCSTVGATAEGALHDLTMDYPYDPSWIEGRIVLIDNLTMPPFYHGLPLGIRGKIEFCLDHGCRGVIIKNAMNQGKLIKWLNLHDVDTNGIPCACVSFEDGERLQRFCKDVGSLPVFLQTEAKIGTGESQNVITGIEGRSSKTILLTAHYDTVGISVGASDNASSVCVLLELAAVLSAIRESSSFEKSIFFAFFGSEELKHQGSRFFADNYPFGKLDDIEFMLNLDELGSGRMKGYRLGTSDRLQSSYNRLLASMGSEYRFHFQYPHKLDNSGDTYSFAVKGIETGGLWRWKYPAESPHLRYRHMNCMEGGSLAHRFRHTEADTPDKVNLGDLKESATEVALFIRALVGES